MRIAVVGCAHGELDSIYATVRHVEQTENIKVDLLICCGDFQAVRNENDLNSLACPAKFRSMNSFWKYYSQQENAPCLTIFIGGNHEASNYLWELYYGGWVAPNIYFLGFAGVVQFGGIRIAGLSGIYKPRDYRSGHYERFPYNESDKRSIYHIREYDVHKLMQINEPIDIFISHDWPRGIAHCGDTAALLRQKYFLKDEVERNILGSEPGKKLLQTLKPSYWFAAHLHTKFAAVVQHTDKTTKFLALDKCLPGKSFMQMIDLPATAPLELRHDVEWLAITRAYNHLLPLSRSYPNLQRISTAEMELQRKWIEEHLTGNLENLIPATFAPTAAVYDPSRSCPQDDPTGHVKNPQTQTFLDSLQLPYMLERVHSQSKAPSSEVSDPNEIAIAEDDDEAMKDPDEIEIGEDDD